MNLVSYFWSRASGVSSRREIVQHGTRPDVAAAQQHPSSHGLDVATTKVAEDLAEPVLQRQLSQEERDTGGKLVHYSFGAGAGAIYGIAMDQLHLNGSRAGIPFGLLVWIGGVLVALPALRLTAPPTAYTPREHALGIVGHVTYGFVLGHTYMQLQKL